MHQLNLDWIIKIAKDFLDQYTHIQQLIEEGEQSLLNLTEEGLQELQDKTDTLAALLQEWYDSHSQDIADQLSEAIADLNEWYTIHQNYLNNILIENIEAFNTSANAKAAETLASIPDDYTEVARSVTKLNFATSDPLYTYDRDIESTSGENWAMGTNTISIETYATHIRWNNPLIISGGNRIRMTAVRAQNTWLVSRDKTQYSSILSLVVPTNIIDFVDDGNGNCTFIAPDWAYYLFVTVVDDAPTPYYIWYKDPHNATNIIDNYMDIGAELLYKLFSDNKVDISELCYMPQYFAYNNGTISIAYDFVTYSSPFLPVGLLSYVKTNGKESDVRPVLFFSDKNISSFLDARIPNGEAFSFGWYRHYEYFTNVPPTAKYFVVQWNNTEIINDSDFEATKYLPISIYEKLTAGKFVPINELCYNPVYYSLDNGNVVQNSDHGITYSSDYIPIELLTYIQTNGKTTDVPAILFFSDKKLSSYISYVNGTIPIAYGWTMLSKYNIAIPENAKYAIIQWNSNSLIHVNNAGIQYTFNKNDVTIKDEFRYIMYSANYTDEKLCISGSNDLRNYKLIYKNIYQSAASGCSVRDPSPITVNGFTYIAHTWGFSHTNAIAIIRTKDFIRYEEMSPISVPSVSIIWAPEFFEYNGKIYIVFSGFVNNLAQTYYAEYDPINNTLGTVERLKLGAYTHIIDTFLLNTENGIIAVTKDETTKYLYVLKGNSMSDTFTTIYDDSVSTVFGNPVEGPVLNRLDNGNYRLTYQDITTPTAGTFFYSDSADLVHWSAKQPITISGSYAQAHGTIIDNNKTWQF